MFVKPKDGRSVPDPDRGDLLPASGREVSPSPYWYRRKLDGDVVIDPPAEPEESEATNKPDKKGAK